MYIWIPSLVVAHKGWKLFYFSFSGLFFLLLCCHESFHGNDSHLKGEANQQQTNKIA